jgi:uncharacterized protein
MPRVTAAEEFEIQTSLSEVWTFISDLSNVGSCIPGCESIEKIDPQSANFRVRIKIGYVSKVLELKAKIKESVPLHHFLFRAEGSDADISGTLDLSGDATTKLRYSIEINPISVVGKTAVSMMGKDLVKKQASEFASCVKARLEKAC